MCDLHAVIGSITDTTAELILTRKCANVSKITHVLRINDNIIEDSALDVHDNCLMNAIERILKSRVDEISRLQSSICFEEVSFFKNRVITTSFLK